MHGLLDLPRELEPIAAEVADALAAVAARIESTLTSDAPQVERLRRHLDGYRGKMLRPALVLLSGAAAAGRDRLLAAPEPITLAATMEAIHLATLVHDDVLDEARTRRGSPTINALTDNETAVILGDYCIAAAFHLCSELRDREAALAVARCCMDTCAGEILQLTERGNLRLDESTYDRIIAGKTGALIGAACRLGALVDAGDPARAQALHDFGMALGRAFQIQDDVLDLVGDPASVGKTLGRDIAKGKLTLPIIHHLATLDDAQRREAEALLRSAAGDSDAAHDAAHRLAERLASTGSVAHAQARATVLSDDAKTHLAALPPSAARDMLSLMADAAVRRSR